jgi:hypothetical protein
MAFFTVKTPVSVADHERKDPAICHDVCPSFPAGQLQAINKTKYERNEPLHAYPSPGTPKPYGPGKHVCGSSASCGAFGSGLELIESNHNAIVRHYTEKSFLPLAVLHTTLH